MKRRTKLIIPGAALVGLALAAALSTGDAAASHAPGHGAPTANLAPEVVHTGKAPTGYEVTFRFKDPSAQRVQIKGEWYFGNPYQLSALSGTSDTDIVATPGVVPSKWKPGDVPMAYPNSTAANWPVVDMKKQRNGVWTYTTPLPSGNFSYGFFVNCTDPAQTGCTEVADPSNAPWNVHHQRVTGSVEPVSQVYVPSDPKFGTQDLSWQAPARKHGTLTDVSYPAPTSTTPAGTNYLGVYLPPGYNPSRAAAYPTMYAIAPDDEVAWTSQGALENTLDNLIDDGEIQPMVVVSPNLNGFPASSDSSVFDSNLASSVIPYVEKHYDVSTSAAQRSIIGMGNAASVVNSLLFDHTTEFSSYGAFGNGTKGPFATPAAGTLTATQVAQLKKVSISVGGGYQDPHHWYHVAEISLLSNAGVAVTPDFVNSGHDWYSWRINAKDFLTRVAFFPPATG
jgi:enterochelin esterase-like enzyme